MKRLIIILDAICRIFTRQSFCLEFFCLHFLKMHKTKTKIIWIMHRYNNSFSRYL